MAHKEYVTRRRSDFTMWNLQLPEDVDKKLDRANMYLGVIADVLADIADILTAKQAERRTINMDTIKILEDMESQQAGIMEKAALADAILAAAQPEQRYTREELRVFQHGISLSLLSKRSSQHWQYDEDTATEIEFLERLYEKVVADMRGEQDEMQ